MKNFYKNKKVLITGNTGFKGSWLSALLLDMGAEVYGYALEPDTKPAIYEILDLGKKMKTCIADVRDLNRLEAFFKDVKPDIVIHMAAQPIVITGYEEPVYTYGVNVMGTVNVLECARKCPSVKSVLNVTTDKVYKNNEWEWGYRECDTLDGFDPYSNSKSCSELVTASYKRSFYDEKHIPLSTARAGNVIGGGDFSPNRIVPDCVRAAKAGKTIAVRNPNSVRPYQHVLEPLRAYLLIAKEQYEDFDKRGNYNVGPEFSDCIKTGELAEKFCKAWGDGAKWESKEINGPHEANFLKLDCSKIKSELNWRVTWNVDDAINKTVEWHKAHIAGENMYDFTVKQIGEFFKGIVG